MGHPLGAPRAPQSTHLGVNDADNTNHRLVRLPTAHSRIRLVLRTPRLAMRVFRPSTASSLFVALATTVAVFTVGSADAATAAELRLNGWYPCGFSNAQFANPENPTEKLFECAEVDVPLCHEGVCESDRTISLFIKRLPANATEENETPKSLYMLQGGPGGSGADMETAMQTVHRLLEFKANLYTVDHRGTGRSFFLQCDAAQGFNGGSPSGVDLAEDEIPDCVRDVLFQIDNQTAAFSVTSAAKDLEFLAQNLHGQDEELYMLGASYGTYLTERLMHLAPSNVKGYILDGVMAEDTARVSFSARNSDNVIPTKRLAQYCEETEGCATMFGEFKKGELYAKWEEIYDELDALDANKNYCVDFLRAPSLGDDAKMVSNYIKNALGGLANGADTRRALPALLKLIQRCEGPDDMRVFMGLALPKSPLPDFNSGSGSTHAEDPAATPAPVPSPQPPQAFDVVGQYSPLLGQLIKISELWPKPSPSWSEEVDTFQGTVFPQSLISDYSLICLISGNASDPSCGSLAEVDRLQNTTYAELEPVAFMYETDQYFGKIATIPDHASVLVINGKLDFQTMSDHGVHQYEMMHGGRGKMMVEMDYGGHCTGIGSTTPDDKTECGPRIIASFVKNGGDVEKVDTSCMEELPVLAMLSADELVDIAMGEPTITAQEAETESETPKMKKAKTAKKAKDAKYTKITTSTKKIRHHQ